MEIKLNVFGNQAVEDAINLKHFIAEHSLPGVILRLKEIPAPPNSQSAADVEPVVEMQVSQNAPVKQLLGLSGIIGNYLKLKQQMSRPAESANTYIEISIKGKNGSESTFKFDPDNEAQMAVINALIISQMKSQ